MKAWRAQLAKWPREKLLLMDPASAPLEMRDPERLRRVQRQTTVASLSAVAAFLGSIGIALLALRVLTSSGTGNFAAALCLGGIGASFVGMFRAAKTTKARSIARGRTQDVESLEARGEGTLGGEYVGVSYAAERWRHPVLGDDMDHGVLRIDFDRLTFVGRDTRFELPASAVVKTEVRSVDEAFLGHRPRLYVTWAEGARTQTFSVESPYLPSARRRVEGIAELQTRLDAWRGERRPAFSAERPFVAPPPMENSQTLRTNFQSIGRAAKLLSALVTVLVWFGTEILLELFHRTLQVDLVLIHMVTVWIAFIAWIYIAMKIERRLPERYRFEDPQATLPAVDLGPTRNEDETKIEQKA